jgi:hypothetical protein
VSSTERWHLDVERFLDARRRWVERDAPSSEQIRLVNDWVLDAMLDPASAGTPDPEVEGIWLGRPGRGTLVLYGLNMEAHLIAVFEIGS